MNLSTSTLSNVSNTTTYEDQLDSSCTEDEWMSIKVLPEFMWVIAGLGIVLNILVLLVFCLHKKPCTVPEIYLSNLVATDLVLMFTLPFWAVSIANKYNWIFGRDLCRLVNFGFGLSFNCSIYFLVLISRDRFLALVHPLSHDRMRTQKCVKLVCLLVWCFCGLLGIPSILCRDIQILPETNVSYCVFACSTTVRYTFEWIEVMFGFIIPFFIIFYCSFMVIQALRKRRIEGVNTQQKMKRKAIILMLVVLLALVIFWVPYHLTKLIIRFILTGIIPIYDFCESLRTMVITMHVTTFLPCFKISVLNPILYVIVGNNFRNKMWDIFRRFTSTSQVTTTPHD